LTRAAVAIAALSGIVMMGSASPASAAATPIGSPGPLTEILVGDDTQCQVLYAGDTDPEFYGDADDGACGTFVALAGVL